LSGRIVPQGWGRGAVATFDPSTGLGEVVADDGTALSFHCTEIADGSRAIAPGAAVSFSVVPGHCGKWEARSVCPSA